MSGTCPGVLLPSAYARPWPPPAGSPWCCRRCRRSSRQCCRDWTGSCSPAGPTSSRRATAPRRGVDGGAPGRAGRRRARPRWRRATAVGLPVLGICRGLQLLNVARGGTLHQHLPDVVGADGHAPAPGVYGRHTVTVTPGSLLARSLGLSASQPAEAPVSSYHHQAIDELGAGLAVSAVAPDGTIEAVEDPAQPFLWRCSGIRRWARICRSSGRRWRRPCRGCQQGDPAGAGRRRRRTGSAVSDADRLRWDARHAAADPSVPTPPDALCEHLEAVPASGRALDVACGRGAVAVWLARRGLAGGRRRRLPGRAGRRCAARRCGRGRGRIRWIAHDLDAGLPAGCRGPYDVVVCQLFRDPRRYADSSAALAPGGLLAITVLSEVDAEPGPFRAAPGELRAALARPRDAARPRARRRGDPASPADRSASAGSAGSSRLATSAATAVVTGTEATSPMLPTSVLTISVATSWLVATSPRLRPERLNSSSSGSDAPGVGQHERVHRRGDVVAADPHGRAGTAPWRRSCGLARRSSHTALVWVTVTSSSTPEGPDDHARPAPARGRRRRCRARRRAPWSGRPARSAGRRRRTRRPARRSARATPACRARRSTCGPTARGSGTAPRT